MVSLAVPRAYPLPVLGTQASRDREGAYGGGGKLHPQPHAMSRSCSVPPRLQGALSELYHQAGVPGTPPAPVCQIQSKLRPPPRSVICAHHLFLGNRG